MPTQTNKRCAHLPSAKPDLTAQTDRRRSIRGGVSGLSGTAGTTATRAFPAVRTRAAPCAARRYFDIWACAVLQLHVFQPARRRALAAAAAIFGKRLDRVVPLPKEWDPGDEGAGRFPVSGGARSPGADL